MKKLAVSLLAVAAGSTMLVPASAAFATTTDPTVDIVDISPNPVKVPRGGETKVKIVVEASPDVDKVEIAVEPADGQVRTFVAKEIGNTEKWVYTVSFNGNDPAGKWKATALATDVQTSKTDSDRAYFYVEQAPAGKLDTRFRHFSANPESVKKGKKIYFAGRLQVNDEGWHNASGEKVNIYYRQSRHSGWKWVARDWTDRHGRFYATTKAWKSGTFKAVFAGNDELNGSTSGYEYVRVKRSWYSHH
ncbi:hypothetical protein GCM10022248_31550 [Nonomuraea soli]